MSEKVAPQTQSDTINSVNKSCIQFQSSAQVPQKRTSITGTHSISSPESHPHRTRAWTSMTEIPRIAFPELSSELETFLDENGMNGKNNTTPEIAQNRGYISVESLMLAGKSIRTKVLPACFIQRAPVSRSTVGRLCTSRFSQSQGKIYSLWSTALLDFRPKRSFQLITT